MADQRLDDFGRVVGCVRDHVEHALGQPGILHRLHDEVMRARADLRRLHHHGIAAGEWRGDRAHAEDHRRVPRRHRKHHARRLADRHRRAAWAIRRDHLAGDLGRQCRGLEQHVGGKSDIEHRPARRGADLLGHRLDEIVGPGAQRVRCLDQQLAAFAGRGRRPARKGTGGGIGCTARIFRRCGCRAGRDIAGDRIAALETFRTRRATALAVDE